MKQDIKGHEIITITSTDGIEAIRPLWENLQHHPLADIDFFLMIVRARQDITEPCIIALKQSGETVALFIGRIDRVDFRCALGYKTFYRKPVKQLTILYGGILGKTSPEIFDAIIKNLQQRLAKREFDIVQFENLTVGSPAFRAATTLPSLINRNRFVQSNDHYTLDMPASMDDFYKSKKSKHRYWLKRIIRVLEKEHAGALRYEIYTDPGDVERVCRDAEAVASRTYHRGIGAGFVDNHENRQRTALLARKGWLRAYVLYIQDRPAAFWIGTYYRGVFYLDFTGYLEEFSRFEIGTVLFQKMIEDLCGMQVKTMDYGFGDAIYKQRFSDRTWQEASVYIFPSSPAGLLMKFMKEFETLATRLLKYLLSRVNIKKLWRKKLASHEENQ